MSAVQRVGERYTVLRNLGSNELETLLARDLVAGDHVVIKRPILEHVTTFAKAAKVAVKLEHEHIVRSRELLDDGGHVTEFIHGEDLREILAAMARTKAVMPLPHVLAIGIAAASALHHAHQQKVVHETVSPSTILIGYDGTIRVIDFASVSRTSRLGYWSPEQVKGGAVDKRTDIWSLGVVLYELATQTRLWRGPEADVRAAIASGRVPLPRVRRPELPNEISIVIMKCLAADPDRRFETMEQVRAALASLAVGDFALPPNKMASSMRKLFGDRPELWKDGAFEARSAGPSTGSGASSSSGGSAPRGEWSTSFTRPENTGSFPRADTRSSAPPSSGPIRVSRPSDTGPVPALAAPKDDRPSRPSRPSKPPMQEAATDWKLPSPTVETGSSKKTFAIAIGGIVAVAIAGVIGVTALGGKAKPTQTPTTAPATSLDSSSIGMPITGGDRTVPRDPANPGGTTSATTGHSTPSHSTARTPGAGTASTATTDRNPGAESDAVGSNSDGITGSDAPVAGPDGSGAPVAPAGGSGTADAPPITQLSQATIDGLAHDHATDLAACRADDVTGTITITFEIDVSGKVVHSQVGSNVNRPQLAACILRTLKTWQFPRPPTGRARGTYTLTYPR